MLLLHFRKEERGGKCGGLPTVHQTTTTSVQSDTAVCWYRGKEVPGLNTNVLCQRNGMCVWKYYKAIVDSVLSHKYLSVQPEAATLILKGLWADYPSVELGEGSLRQYNITNWAKDPVLSSLPPQFFLAQKKDCKWSRRYKSLLCTSSLWWK